MWNFLDTPGRLGEGSSRRGFLRVGTLGGFGLALRSLLGAAAGPDSAPNPAEASLRRARRCVLLFLTGGPPHRHE